MRFLRRLAIALAAIIGLTVCTAGPASAANVYDECWTSAYDGSVWLDFDRFGSNVLTIREFTFRIGYRDVIGANSRVRVRVYVKPFGMPEYQVLDWQRSTADPGTWRVNLTDTTYQYAGARIVADFTFDDPLRSDPSCTARSGWA